MWAALKGLLTLVLPPVPPLASAEATYSAVTICPPGGAMGVGGTVLSSC